MRGVLVVIALSCVLAAACSSSSKAATEPTTSAPSAPSTTAASHSVVTVPGNIATTIKESAYIVRVDPAARTITIDPMEFLVGAAAAAEYHKQQPSAPAGVPDDYLVVNPTKDHVVLPMDPNFDLELVHIGNASHRPPVAAPLSQLSREHGLDVRPFWVTVQRGVATGAEEQFIP